MDTMPGLMIRIAILFELALITTTIAKAQDIPGYNMSNYAGVSGIDIQPASIADMRYKLDITVVGAGIDFNNNYISVYSKYILDKSIFQTYQGNFNAHFLSENTSLQNVEVGLNTYVQLPSIALSITRDISVAFTCRLRSLLNIDNLSPQLAHLMYTGLSTNDPSNLRYFNTSLKDNTFSFNQMSWWEYGIDYAQVISSRGHHFFKMGVRGKLEAGLEAAFLKAQTLNYNWKNNDTLSLYNSTFLQGHTENLVKDLNGNFNAGKSLGDVSAISVAMDIGFVYEWRPDYYDWGYRLRGKYRNDKRDLNKYKIRLGASLLDIGFMSFQKGDNAYNFNANKTNWDVNALRFGPNKLYSLDTIIANNLGRADTRSYFHMYFPTTFSLQADYNIYNDLYVNVTTYTVPQFMNVTSQVHGLSYYTVTPRWDYKWFGFFLPVGVNGYGQTTFGMTLRLGPLIVGTGNGLNLLFTNNIYGLNAYAALKIPILFEGSSKSKKDVCPTNGF